MRYEPYTKRLGNIEIQRRKKNQRKIQYTGGVDFVYTEDILSKSKKMITI